jgi:hypothetical protein
MLWDGESHGILMNVMRLAAAGKPAVIYMQAQGVFLEVRTRDALNSLLRELGAGSAARLRADAAAEGLSPQFDQLTLGLWIAGRLTARRAGSGLARLRGTG